MGVVGKCKGKTLKYLMINYSEIIAYTKIIPYQYIKLY